MTATTRGKPQSTTTRIWCRARVTLIGHSAALPELVVMGSHDIALDTVIGLGGRFGTVAP